MNHISELSDILNESFQWNKTRITFFALMLIALITTRTVNWSKLANAIASDADKKSRYRRIQRFFAHFNIDYDMIAAFIFKLFFIPEGKWYLTMDRTNWMWGEADINILTLAVVFKGIAIPVYWELLDNKGGNSNTKQRICIVQKFIDKFGKDCIAGLLADREFIGHDWFKWLKNERIPFVIRIKNNLLTTNSRGKTVPVKDLFRGMKPTEERVLWNKRSIMGQCVYVSGLKMPSGEVLIVATDMLSAFAIKTYALRWEIETLFSCLKERGFNVEDTNVINQERIKKLLALLAIAFCWAHKTGEWRHEQKTVKIKTHGRPEVSIFRYGLDYINDILVNFIFKNNLFESCLDRIRPSKLGLNLQGCPS
jgi:hypothetical protein